MAKIGYGYGSEWHLLLYLGRRRDAFTRAIEDLTGVSSIHWRDCKESADASTGAPSLRELVGLEFMEPKDSARMEWERRWPHRGGVHNWDAVGQGVTHDRQTWILVEAKANVNELISPCHAKNPESLQKIRSVLDDTRRDLRVTAETDWTQDYYQYCNRIALLHFLDKHEVDAHLVFVYFTGDRDDLGSPRNCPTNEEDWQDALDAQDHHVGLPADSRIHARAHRIFLPAYHVPIDERVLKPEYCRSRTLDGGRSPTQAAPRSPPPRDHVRGLKPA